MSYLKTGNKSMRVSGKRFDPVIAAFIFAILIMSSVLVACDETAEPTPVDESDPAEETGSEQPGEIIATVNGKEIYREEFEQALEQEKMQYEMQGIDLDSVEMADTLRQLEEQVLDNLIIPNLILQKANEVGITVSDEEVEERYQEYATTFGGEDALLEQMENFNISRDELDEDIVKELSIQNYLDQYMDDYLEANPEEEVVKDDLDITDEELEAHYQQLRTNFSEIQEMLEKEDPEIPREQIEAYYQQLEEQYGDLLEEDDFEAIKPKLEEEVRVQMAEEMKEEKVQRVISEHLKELEEESDIEKNI